MAKYIKEFNTYADYSAATLNYPNVSLIKTTGKLYYNNVYAGASFGDILMYDVANQKLITTIGGNWDTTMYPIASYVPIAINVYPASKTPDNKSRYLSIKWVSTGSTTGSTTTVMLPQTCGVKLDSSSSMTEFNGASNTQYISNEANYSTNFPWFYAVNIFAPSGTSAGDWYVPSAAEVAYLKEHLDEYKNVLQTLKDASSSIINTIFDYLKTSTSNSSGGCIAVAPNASWYFGGCGSWGHCRAMLSL